mgnify:CR=1 FL=1
MSSGLRDSTSAVNFGRTKLREVGHLPGADVSCQCSGEGHRMSKRREDLSDSMLGVVEDAQLSEETRSVVVDALAREFVLVVECEHCARIPLDLTAGPRKSSPVPLVSPADRDLQNHVLVGHVALVNVDMEVGECLEQVLVVGTDAVAAIVVLTDRFVIVPRVLPNVAMIPSRSC